MTDLFTLCHKSDPQTSYDAGEKMVKSGALSRQERTVYDEIVRYDRMLGEDFTTKDIARQMVSASCPYHKCYEICRRRFSGLHNQDKIERIQIDTKITHTHSIPSLKIEKPIYKKREGCAVWKLTK